MRVRALGLGLIFVLGVGCDDELPTTGGGDLNNAGGLPCDVKTILETHCQECHSDPPQYGAPMALSRWAELREHAAAAADRVASGSMPPPSQTPMTPAEQATLVRWLEDGAPRASEACGASSAPPTRPTAGNQEECDYLFEMRAHGGQRPGDTTPFDPRGAGLRGASDRYEMFYFVPPWTEEVHTIRVDSIEDNKAVLHHWLLYQEPGNGTGNGTHRQNIGLHTGQTQLLHGWAPGGQSPKLAEDVGIETISGPNSRFALEIHYNTGSNPRSTLDRSGARVCATRNLRPKVAAVHWLGTQAIAGSGRFTATGRCSPRAEAHILSYSPHMHETGVHMKTEIRRSNGTVEILNDRPFAFEDQAQYYVDSPTGEVVVGRGDVLTTTCTYQSSGFITFGPGTAQEMCYNFLVAWPVGSLTTAVGGFGVGGQNSCIDGF